MGKIKAQHGKKEIHKKRQEKNKTKNKTVLTTKEDDQDQLVAKN